MDRITRDQALIQTLAVWEKRSTCSRNQVAALAVREGRILVTGYNGAPSGLPHCEHLDDEPCTVSVHAEANVVAYAARYGISLAGAEIWCSLSPCLACAQLIVNTGIYSFRYVRKYREDAGISLLLSAGVRCAAAQGSPIMWSG